MTQFISIPAWTKTPNLVHGFGTDFPGWPEGNLQTESEIEKAKRHSLSVGIRAALSESNVQSYLTVKQVHSSDVVLVDDSKTPPPVPDGITCDAIVTNRLSLVIGVKTADCLPILAYDPQKRVAAAIHAGWRGTIGEILKNAIELMQRDFGSKTKHIQLAFGPCARVAAYEVSEDLAERFEKRFSESVVDPSFEKPHLDIPAANRLLALSCGIRENNIFDTGLCTMTSNSPHFYSWRRDAGQTGRLFNFIALLPN